MLTTSSLLVLNMNSRLCLKIFIAWFATRALGIDPGVYRLDGIRFDVKTLILRVCIRSHSADVQMTEAQPEKPEATLISSHQTLSSDEFTKVTRLEKKVHEMSCFNLPQAIDNSGKAYLKNVLPKDVPYCGKIKLEKAKKSMPKNSSTPVDQADLDEFEEKDS
ncbi:hypothetical protein Tco_0688581 [Tanacetum coccineum]